MEITISGRNHEDRLSKKYQVATAHYLLNAALETVPDRKQVFVDLAKNAAEWAAREIISMHETAEIRNGDYSDYCGHCCTCRKSSRVYIDN